MEEISKKKPVQLSKYTMNLIKKIPLTQRRKIIKNGDYRKGWLDSTLFWYQQVEEIFDRSSKSRYTD
jgi:hypothetical protein